MLCDAFSGVLKVSVWPCTMSAQLTLVFEQAQEHERSCKKWLQSEISQIEAAKNKYSTFNVKCKKKILVTLYNTGALIYINSYLTNAQIIMS